MLNIIEIKEYNSNTSQQLLELSGNKIYLLDIEVPGKKGIELLKTKAINSFVSSTVLFFLFKIPLKIKSFFLTDEFVDKFDTHYESFKELVDKGVYPDKLF